MGRGDRRTKAEMRKPGWEMARGARSDRRGGGAMFLPRLAGLHAHNDVQAAHRRCTDMCSLNTR